jgi:iron complex transport system ATP-binding protein
MSLDLDFADITLQKGGRNILDRVSGCLRVGQVTVVLGANGAGKSSLLSCLAGLAVHKGSVHLGGRLLSAMSPVERARLIGFLPQKGELHWNLSVHALVALGRMAHNGGGCLTGDDEAMIDAAMAHMDIVHLAQRQVLSLSGGEQARVLFSRVLAGEPRWLLTDEPLASLDPAHQLALLDRLIAAARSGAGVVAVLHDVNHAARIADHVIMMRDGRIMAQGRRDDILTPDLLERAFGVAFRMTPDGRGFLLPHGSRPPRMA